MAGKRIVIDPDWPEWKKEEARAVNARVDALAAAKAKPSQSGGPQGPSDFARKRAIRRAGAAKRAARRKAAQPAIDKALNADFSPRDKVMEFVDRAQSGQSTDSAN
jgi:hypothetical protein